MEGQDLEKYLVELREKILDRGLDMFWVMADRADFKVIRMKHEEVKNMLVERVSSYRNKRIARIYCYVDPRNVHKPNAFVMSIKVIICEISEEGKINHKPGSSYGLCVNFYPEDFQKIKFSLKLVESLLRLAAGKKKAQILTDVVAGMPYEAFSQHVANKGLSWDFSAI